MKIALKDLVEIRSGYSFRTALQEVPDGVSVLQIRDLEESGRVDPSKVVQVRDEGFKDSHRVKAGEVLFAARGSMQRAGVFEGDPAGAVAGSQFLVVKVKEPQKLLPEFLAWYFNSSDVKRRLESMARGATIPHVSITMLKRLEMVVPSVETQRQLVAMHELGLKELELLKEMQVEVECLSRARMKQILKLTMENENDE